MRTLQLCLLLAACAGAEPSSPEALASPTKTAPPPPPPAGEVGPDGPTDLAIPTIALSEDPEVVAAGKAVYEQKGCGACHRFGGKLVGPDLEGLPTRRSAAWTARMISYPDQMTKRDPVAKDLFRAHLVQMTDQGVPDESLAPLVSYLYAEGR